MCRRESGSSGHDRYRGGGQAERNEKEESTRFDEVRVENLKTHFVKPGALLIST